MPVAVRTPLSPVPPHSGPAAALLATLLSAAAAAQPFEARNRAMGGAGVASTRWITAAMTNPALITRADGETAFGIALPTLGALVDDRDGLIDAIDDFQASLTDLQDRLNAGGTATPAELLSLAAQLQSLGGRTAHSSAGGGFALTFPSEALSISLFVASQIDGQAFVNVDPGDLVRIATATNPGDLDNIQSEGVVLAAALTDVGLAFAHEVDFGGPSLSIGVTPKLQRVDTFNYSVNVDTFENEEFDDDQFRNDDLGFNLDLGAAFSPIPQLTLGIAGRNLIEEEYRTVTTNGNAFTYHVHPRVTAGVAFATDLLTIAADIDVVDIERFELADTTQSFRIGAELDFGDFLQLRGGYSHDFEDGLDDLYTAGLGFSPLELLYIDITGMTAGNDTWGAVVQLAFAF